MPPQLTRKSANQRRQHGPIRPRQARLTTDLATQNRDSWRSTNSSAAIAESPRVACGNQPNIRTAVTYIRRTSMLSIVRDGHRIPAHVMCNSSGAVHGLLGR